MASCPCSRAFSGPMNRTGSRPSQSEIHSLSRPRPTSTCRGGHDGTSRPTSTCRGGTRWHQGACGHRWHQRAGNTDGTRGTCGHNGCREGRGRCVLQALVQGWGAAAGGLRCVTTFHFSKAIYLQTCCVSVLHAGRPGLYSESMTWLHSAIMSWHSTAWHDTAQQRTVCHITAQHRIARQRTS